MKVYFTASAKYKDQRKENYLRIIDWFREQKHEVFEKVMSIHLPNLDQASLKQIREWHLEWLSYIRECDFAVVEASYPSTVHIGFELGAILSRGKPTVLLYQKGCNPVLINRMHSKRLVKSKYDDNDLEEVLEWCLAEVIHSLDRRFTFFIPPAIDTYLESVAEEREMSRAEYIRSLIEEEMKEREAN